MKLKQLTVGLALAGMVSTQVFAKETETLNVPAFTEVETSLLFEQGAEPMQLASLSSEEMRETEGAAGALGINLGGAALGGAAGGITTVGGWMGRNYRDWSWKGFFENVWLGASGGFLSPASGARSFAGAALGGFCGNALWWQGQRFSSR